ncbi:MAG: calcium-binding protein [Pseudomonadota bacterium]
MLSVLLPVLLVGLGLSSLIGGDDDTAGTVETETETETETGITDRGTSASDSLEGGSGNDLLDGRGGNDELSGNDGNDTLQGGNAFDTLDGGNGADLLEGGAGQDALFGGAGADELQGGDGEDGLVGGAGDDVLRGNAGDDGLYGGAGNDTLFGNEGDDVLYGIDVIDDALLTPDQVVGVVAEETFEEFVDINADNGEADTLNGGRDDDVLLVGSADTAIGGGGSDFFTLGDWVTPGAPAIITDFDPSEDTIVYAHQANQPPVLSFGEDQTQGRVGLFADGQLVAYLDNVALDVLDLDAIAVVSL